MRAIVLALVAMMLVGAAPTAKTARPIAIVINGDALPLQPGPRFERNVLFVPVRKTIEALGLEFDKSGRTVTTYIGSHTVELEVGSRVAHMDGDPIYLDAPAAEFKDVLYVPLRFFTDVLGAQASFDRKTSTVTIVAQIVGRSGDGVTTDRESITRIGTVTAVDLDSDPPTVTLSYNSAPRTIPIGANADISLHDVDANVTTPGELSDLQPGDFARITMERSGHVTDVEDEFGSYSGVIAAVAPDQFVLNDGHVIQPGRTTAILLNSKVAALGDLAVGDRATVRYNIESNEVRQVLVSRTVPTAVLSANAVQIDSVDTSADHPLRAGDTFSVTLHGTAGGAASFDIGPYVTALAMSESQAGIYTAEYTIPGGANFTDVPIIGHLRVHGAEAPDIQAPETLWASGSAPGVSAFAPDNGSVVNTTRPAVYVTFAADAVPVNPSSIVLWVDGRDVTSDCVRTAQFIQYMPTYNYRPGSVHVTVRVADRAGNTTTKSWDFTIRQ